MKTKVGLTHEPRRDKPWRVYWWSPPDEDGKQKKSTKSFLYKREAQAFQSAKQTEIDRNESDVPQDVTLGVLLDEFWKARVATLSYSSQVCYKNTIDQLRDKFGSARLLSRIRQKDAEMFISSRTRVRDDGRKGALGSHAIKQHVKYCRAIFGAAIEWGYVKSNPFVPANRQGNSPLRVKLTASPWHHIEPDEFTTFLAEVHDVRRRAICWLMYGCGLRPGEAYNMTSDRVDFTNRRVYVESRPATKDVPPFTVKSEEASKESKNRSVPIPSAAIPDLLEASKLAMKSGGFVGLSPERFENIQRRWRLCREGKPWDGKGNHRPWLNRDMVNNTLRSLQASMKRSGVELTAPLKLTTFRKSFGQNHADAGTPPRTLAKLMGHSDVSITMEFYNRVTDANEQAAAAAMDRLLSSGETTQKAELAS